MSLDVVGTDQLKINSYLNILQIGYYTRIVQINACHLLSVKDILFCF